MKVKVVLSVEIDPDRWAAAYGEPEALPDEVRSYVSGLVAGAEATRRGAIVGVGVAGRPIRSSGE